MQASDEILDVNLTSCILDREKRGLWVCEIEKTKICKEKGNKDSTCKFRQRGRETVFCRKGMLFTRDKINVSFFVFVS